MNPLLYTSLSSLRKNTIYLCTILAYVFFLVNLVELVQCFYKLKMHGLLPTNVGYTVNENCNNEELTLNIVREKVTKCYYEVLNIFKFAVWKLPVQ